MKSLRVVNLVVVLATIAWFGARADAEELPRGVVAEKPSEGRFVEFVDDAGQTRYMVPYEATIPGSEVVFEMMPIPGGVGQIGSPADESDRADDEGPTFRVRFDPYWMGKYEVTWSEYKEYMALYDPFVRFAEEGLRPINPSSKADAITAPSKLYEPSFTFSAGDDPRQPAITMTQYGAKQYTKWLSLLTEEFYRLPSEVEWEHAARAGTKTAFYFGDDASQLGEYAWHTDNSEYETHLVGEKKPNPWGLYDVYGNAAEWCLDQFYEDRYSSYADKEIDVAEAVAWPEKLYPRVLRGGSWDDDPADCRSAARGVSDDDEWRSYDPNRPQSPWWFASDESQDVGFRIMRPLRSPTREHRDRYWQADLEIIKSDANERIDHEGKGARGIVDPKLPEAIKQLPPE